MRRGRASRTPAVVLNLSRNGLGVVRSLGTRGVPVIGVDSQLDRPGAYSRYCQAVRCPDPNEDQPGLLACLQALGGKLGQRAVMFPTSDAYVRFLSEHRRELSQQFSLALAPAAAIGLTVDKRRTYAAARQLGIPVPVFGFADDEDSLEQLARGMPYPCLIKPTMSHTGTRPIAGKALRVESARELVDRYRDIEGSWTSLVVQEMIPGGDETLWTLGAYLDADVRPLAVFSGHKLRQFPPEFGTCSLGECQWDLEVVKLGLRLLTGIGYVGPTQVEFKRDPRDGQLKLMEINARTWLWHSLATNGHVDLAYVAYLDLIGCPPRRCILGRPGARWLSIVADTASARRYIRRGDLSWRTWLRSWRGVQELDVLSLRDPAPFVAMLWGVARHKATSAE